MTSYAPRVILASASASRARLLSAAGIVFAVQPPDVDEEKTKVALRAAKASSSACAEALAELKAAKISETNPDAFVIGADQMLECEDRWFDKPPTLTAARAQLLALSGKTHLLPTAVTVARGGCRLWSHVTAPRLTMRPFDGAFVDGYLARVGDKALNSVGAYQLEGLGVHLFAGVEGDFFTILGLPLLPLLAFLREHKVVPA